MGGPGSIQTRTHSTWPQNIWPPRLLRELFPAGHMTEESEVGATPGHLAAQLALVSTMQAFLHAGFDISLTDRDGDTVLFYALHGDRDIIGYLLGAGGIGLFNVRNRDGDTILHRAVLLDSQDEGGEDRNLYLFLVNWRPREFGE